eukprot:8085756-Alexandrium_andersonii.AAC.1
MGVAAFWMPSRPQVEHLKKRSEPGHVYPNKSVSVHYTDSSGRTALTVKLLPGYQPSNLRAKPQP